MEKTLICLAENVSSSCIHVFSKSINIFEKTLATTVNEFVINELIKLTMLWTTEPRYSLVNIIFQSPCRYN